MSPYSKPERREQISRSFEERIEVSRVRINGRKRVDVRIFRRNKSGHWVPKQGLAIRMSEAPLLAAALSEVVKPVPVLGEA